MKMPIGRFLLSCLFLMSLSKLMSQEYIADTLFASMNKSQQSTFKYTLLVHDNREESPRFLSVYEKKKWLFFPVDQYILTKKPVARELQKTVSGNGNDKYLINMHEFYLKHNETMFNRQLKLNGAFEFSAITPTGDTNLLGTFYYEEYSSNKKKQPLTIAYEQALTSFRDTFIYDLNHVSASNSGYNKPGDFHFRKGVPPAQKNLYVSTDAFYGITFWGLDAEVWFSSPEPAQKFNRKTRMFRYLNYSNRQTVALSAGVSQFNYRINQRWLFQNKWAFLLGFNKWSDVDEKKRTLEEIFTLQLTATQKISFNPLDQSGFVFGAGLMEEVSYIIYSNPFIHVGAVFSVAYKF